MPTLTISPKTCTNLGGKAYRLCLPPRNLCEDVNESGNDTLITEIGKHWNCNTCQADAKYSIPYVKGDVIHLQTQFYDSHNADRKNPTAGFGFMMDAVVTDGTTRIPMSGMVAYGCGRNFQITVIDTSALNLDCWAVEFTVYNGDGSVRRTAQSQEYARISDTECRETVLIRGEGRGIDCFGNCYDNPDAFAGDLVVYNNAMRFWGSVYDTGGNFDKPAYTSDYFGSESTTTYRMALSRKIPPFAKNVLLRQLMKAPKVTIDGERYDLESFSVDNQVSKGRMFLFGVDLERKCKGFGC